VKTVKIAKQIFYLFALYHLKIISNNLQQISTIKYSSKMAANGP